VLFNEDRTVVAIEIFLVMIIYAILFFCLVQVFYRLAPILRFRWFVFTWRGVEVEQPCSLKYTLLTPIGTTIADGLLYDVYVDGKRENRRYLIGAMPSLKQVSVLPENENEMAIPSSRIFPVKNKDAVTGYFIIDDVVVGQFFRVKWKGEDCLVTAFHVFELCFNRGLDNVKMFGSNPVGYSMEKIKPSWIRCISKDGDICILALPRDAFAAMGVPVLKIGECKLRRQVKVCARDPVTRRPVESHGRWEQAFKPRDLTSSALHYCTTAPSFSGAPVISNNSVIGIHLGSYPEEGCNRFAPFDFYTPVPQFIDETYEERHKAYRKSKGKSDEHRYRKDGDDGPGYDPSNHYWTNTEEGLRVFGIDLRSFDELTFNEYNDLADDSDIDDSEGYDWGEMMSKMDEKAKKIRASRRCGNESGKVQTDPIVGKVISLPDPIPSSAVHPPPSPPPSVIKIEKRPPDHVKVTKPPSPKKEKPKPKPSVPTPLYEEVKSKLEKEEKLVSKPTKAKTPFPPQLHPETRQVESKFPVEEEEFTPKPDSKAKAPVPQPSKLEPRHKAKAQSDTSSDTSGSSSGFTKVESKKKKKSKKKSKPAVDFE
jgi:hypothetical protein